MLTVVDKRLRPCIDVDVVDEEDGSINQHLFSFAIAKEILSRMEDLIDVQASRYIFLF